MKYGGRRSLPHGARKYKLRYSEVRGGGGGGVLHHTEPENINYATVKFGGGGVLRHTEPENINYATVKFDGGGILCHRDQKI